MKKLYVIPIFVPHLGCPNECVFCNQKNISGQLKQVKAEDVEKQVEYYLKNFKNDDTEKEIAFYGGSFTAIDQKVQEELLQATYKYIKDKRVQSIRISTRPDYIDKDKLKFLKKYGVKTIELGVQSANDFVLKNSKRGHTFEDVEKASKLIRRNGFVLGHQMMVGLPDSTKDDEIETAKKLIKLKPKIVRIYPVLVIKDTELEKMYNNKEYEALTVDQAVDRCKELYYLFDKKKIDVIRIGLQNTEEISTPGKAKSKVVAGPYHPAFRQLVEGEIWYDTIVEKIKKLNVKSKEIQITVHPVNVNNVVGHRKNNFKKLKELYNVDIIVKTDDTMKKTKLDLKVLSIYPEFLEE